MPPTADASAEIAGGQLYVPQGAWPAQRIPAFRHLASHTITDFCPDVAWQNLIRVELLCRLEAPPAGWQRDLAANQSSRGTGPVCAAPEPGCHMGRPAAAHDAGPQGKFTNLVHHRQAACPCSFKGPASPSQVVLAGLTVLLLCKHSFPAFEQLFLPFASPS